MTPAPVIDPRTWCHYSLPPTTPTATLKQYHDMMKTRYGNYSHHRRHVFYFRFTCTIDRDRFLDSLEITARQTLRVERIEMWGYNQ